MFILALETSDLDGAVAVVGEGQIWSKSLPTGSRSATTLAPTIRELLCEAGLKPAALGAVAVTSGPGSFTGLRVGVMTAKMLAYALGRPCLGVNTLDVIASQVSVEAVGANAHVWAIIDAQRNQLFAASYQRKGHQILPLEPTRIIDRSVWLEGLRPGDFVTGPGLAQLRAKLSAVAPLQIAEETTWRPTAAAVGRVAAKLLGTQYDTDAWRLRPQYYRLSAAEEKARNLPPAV